MLEVVDLLLVGLGHGTHQESYVVPEPFPDVLNRVWRILYHVVKQGCSHYGRVVLAHFLKHYERHCKGMQDVGCAALAFLGPVGLFRKFAGVVDKSYVLV